MSERKIALLFPGQGAQAIGMGKSFRDDFSVFRETFEEAEDLLGFSLSKVVYGDSDDELRQTRFSQLALYVEGIAIWRVISAIFPMRPVIAGGLSLGEYTALTAEGRLDFSTGVRVVDKRATIMDAACCRNEGAMAAIIGMNSSQIVTMIDALGLQAQVWLANAICPGQMVVSGKVKGIQTLVEKAREHGARKAIPLNVHGAFHSPLMQSAGDEFAPTCRSIDLKTSPILHAMNVSGKVSTDNSEIIDCLVGQITHPVLWESNIRAMVACAPDLYLEIGGSGKTLMGANRRIDKQLSTLSIEEVEDLIALENELLQPREYTCQ